MIPTNQYEVLVDASKKGFGATLSQLINGRMVSYWSKAVPHHMKRLGASRLEFLCLHHALMYFRIYLEGTEFVVKTDCKALSNLDTIFNKENMQRRLQQLKLVAYKIMNLQTEILIRSKQKNNPQFQ